MTLDIKSYARIGDVPFGASQCATVSSFGQPNTQELNDAGEIEYHYSDFIVRFDRDGHTLRECTLLPTAKASLNGVPITWDDHFLAEACSCDGDPYEGYGFVALFRLGVVMWGFHDPYETEKGVSAFRRGDWDARKEKMRKFELKKRSPGG